MRLCEKIILLNDMDLATMLERVASPDTETRTQAEALIAQVTILYSSSLTYISTQSTRSDAV